MTSARSICGFRRRLGRGWGRGLARGSGRRLWRGLGRRLWAWRTLALALGLAGLLSGVAALRLPLLVRAQSSREAYRDAFRAWRDADPPLESDAARAGAGWAQRTAAAGALAARYTAARAEFLRAAVADVNQSLAWLRNARQPPDPEIAPAVDMQTTISASTALVSMQISTYAGDPDPTLVPLRQALERERSALVALSSAMSERQRAASRVVSAGIAAEQARAQAMQPYQSMASALTDVAAGTDQEAQAWAEYYRKLGDSAQVPVSVAVPAGNGEVRINNPARRGDGAVPVNPGQGGAGPGPAGQGAAGPGAVAQGNPALGGVAVVPHINNPAVGAPELSARVNNPPPIAPPATVTSRYAGNWTFPTVGGMYHGPRPQSVALVLQEAGGQLSGTLQVRFAPFGDVKTASDLRFEFSGMAVAGRVQSLPLVTSEGAKGKIDLIPGPAFNLLEVNFYTDRQAGKVSQGNVLLIRK